MEKSTECRFRSDYFCSCLLLIMVVAAFVVGIGVLIISQARESRHFFHDVLVDESHHPRLYIRDLYVPSLANKTTTFNTSVFVHLSFERNAAIANHTYGDFRMILSYGEYRSKSIRVGSRTVEGFSMGYEKRVDVKARVEATEMPWEEAFRAVSDGKVAMVVELLMSFASDELPLVARVVVDDSGHMIYTPIAFEEWRVMSNV